MSKRYSPTEVKRYVQDKEGWAKIESYPDATVRDQGASGYLRVPEAMLRAYSDDPEVWQKWDKHDEWFVCSKKLAKEYYGEDMEGMVLDCDGDLALERIMMQVLSMTNLGHGFLEYIGYVSYNEDNGEWDGFGFGGERVRIERWTVHIHE